MIHLAADNVMGLFRRSPLKRNFMTTFSEIVDAADNLSPDEQQVLVDILSRRLAERNREQLVGDVADARREFADGAARPASPQQIMDEVRGEA
jgi:hypothetical protein